MGIIGKTILVGAAVGFGYYLANSHAEKAPRENATLEAKRGGRSIAGPQDLSIDHVVSEKFDGLVFTNAATGERGFLVKTPSFDGSSRFSYLPLEFDIPSPAEVTPLYQAPGMNGFRSEDYHAGSGIKSLFKKIDRFIYDQTIAAD